MDEKDLKLLDFLTQDARASTYRIAKKTGIPQTTVLNRLKKLQESGIIKKYTMELDYKQLGKKVTALVFVKIDKQVEKKKQGTVGDIEKALIKDPAVTNIKRLMGKMDIMLEVRVRDVDELNEFLINKVRKRDEIAETETVIVLEEWNK